MKRRKFLDLDGEGFSIGVYLRANNLLSTLSLRKMKNHKSINIQARKKNNLKKEVK